MIVKIVTAMRNVHGAAIKIFDCQVLGPRRLPDFHS
jgi:hypothetical protein